jgi:hypothetical protein
MSYRYRCGFSMLLLLAMCLLLAACDGTLESGKTISDKDASGAETSGAETSDRTPTPQILGSAEIAPAVATGQRLPLWMLLQFTEPGDPRPIPTLDETKESLASDPKLEPLRAALEAGGWSDEQAAQMVYFAASHNSGQPADSIRARHEKLHAQAEEVLDEFEADLRAYEQANGVKIDRRALRENGIFTTFKTYPIQDQP